MYIIICVQFKLLNLLMVEVGLGKMIGVVINYLKKSVILIKYVQ